MGLLDRLLRYKPEEMTADDFASLANEIEDEQKQINATTDDLVAQMSELSPKDLAWAEWFSQLPEPHKQFVEMCSKRSITVNEDNFDQVFEFVKSQMAED